jgi:hypothetical protein
MEVMIASRIVLVQGDITTEKTQAIVNAANSGLSAGGRRRHSRRQSIGFLMPEDWRLPTGRPSSPRAATPGNTLSHRRPIYRGGTGEESSSSAYRKASACLRGGSVIRFPRSARRHAADHEAARGPKDP